MSLIDLRKLRARKKFFVPAKSSAIHELILEQINPKGHPEWLSMVRLKRSGEFTWNYRFRWAENCAVEDGAITPENIAKFMKEFDKNIGANVDFQMSRSVKNLPWRIRYVISDEQEEGCICEVTCCPNLYGCMIRRLDTECKEYEMQDALLNCEEYLTSIMVGGLGGKEIVDKIESSQWELLISYTGCPNISERVNYMLERATSEVLIVGWIGTPLIKQLRELKNKGIDIKAITHNPRDARNEPFVQEVSKGYQELINIIGLANVSAKQEMHGRAIIVDNKAIIGSMDTTSDSLIGPHVEFAIYTDDVDTVRKIRAYFKSIFTPLKTP